MDGLEIHRKDVSRRGKATSGDSFAV